LPTETIAATDLKQLASDVLARALKAGATDAEAVVYEGDEFSTLVRLGQVETLKESGSRAVGLRVFIASGNAQRTASTSSSDFSPESLERLVAGAVTLARITSEDPFAGLPEPSEFSQHDAADQHLYFDDVNQQPPADRIHIAREVEAASMAFDTRIQNSGGGDFDTATSHKILMNSRGFVGEYRRSYCGFSAQPIAHDADGKMQPAAPCNASARARQRPSRPLSSSRRRSPAPSSATSSTQPTATPSIATPAPSPECWVSV